MSRLGVEDVDHADEPPLDGQRHDEFALVSPLREDAPLFIGKSGSWALAMEKTWRSIERLERRRVVLPPLEPLTEADLVETLVAVVARLDT